MNRSYRKYTKLQELLNNVSSLSNLLTLIFGLLVRTYKKRILSHLLIDKTIRFKKKSHKKSDDWTKIKLPKLQFHVISLELNKNKKNVWN